MCLALKIQWLLYWIRQDLYSQEIVNLVGDGRVLRQSIKF